MTPVEFLLAAAVLAVASALQGAVGFGANIVAVPVLLLIDPGLVPGPSLVAVAGLNLMMVVRDHGATSMRPLATALIGRLAGTVVGVAALTVLGDRGLAAVVAATVLASVALIASGLRVARTPPNLLAAGAVSGFGASTAGIGGPPLALVYADADGPEIRGSMGVLFTVGNVVSLAGLALAGLLDGRGLALGLALLPTSLAGFAASRPLAVVLDRGHTRTAALAMSVVAAAVLLVRIGIG